MTRNSIYRGWRALPSDVHDQDVTVRGPTPRKMCTTEPAKDYGSLRKGRPADRLLPRTVDWILALPPTLRPHLLAGKYARIANQLCTTWNDPAACRLYFDDLMSDRRGGRGGFPMGIGKELLALRRFYARLHGERDDRWQDAPRRHSAVR
jgi:hypothetical protein